MEKNELSSFFEKCISLEKIDVSKFNIDNNPIEEQLVIVNIFFKEPAFYYDKCDGVFSVNPGNNFLNIQTRSIKNIISFETRGEGILQPISPLIGGDCIYDLKVKGNSIKNVELKILSEVKYSLPFEHIDNEWVLKKFSKSEPLLLGCMAWCKYYLEVTKEENEEKDNDNNEDHNKSDIMYSYSIIICRNEILNRIIGDKLKFDNITYDKGYINMNQ